ncbi:EscU/YscU/HrcU family type III secretion system export apparatus switch protein [Duganella sp. BJB488]|uniref:type III secretion system export apparatus subunit SctU n=1 Tax=unclassified Duganella TaxID=2636909 RepID=UPI000E34ED2B|nr:MULTISPECIES: type III secretion system export apparatus subunit SctU [unclassified Duganella]RFP13235.1 EscU/YscU/HrcU family type III secretion system export apparatus switch protein [Duganella sp. BJB489]RFP17190.1 EscU/YscU/HrcU family type III secretion system export apparatus switch protein [Duganella sp. BJB488]RFP31590.1 EscU/YscU/HrcU family type III secretion system export apparatus switch protein [Duganella sp. BJB480]
MSDEKTERPTEKKLQDARRDGESTKSTDLGSAAVLLSVVALMALGGTTLGDGLRALLHGALDEVTAAGRPGYDLYTPMLAIALQGARLLLPFLLATMVAAVAGIWAQTGINISFKPVELKFSAVDPAAGMQRIFSVRSLIDLLKMVVKAVVIFAVMRQTLMLLAPLIVGTAYLPVADIVQISWQVLYQFIAIGGVLALLMGAVDFGIQRWLFIRDHRMSKDDIKREHKDSEGDPRLKGQRKAVAKEMAQGAPASALKGAQAVIVNPTHYAVALRYAPEEMGLPRVIAKGVDADALALRRAAQQQGIPIIGNPPLARALYTVALHHPIPEPLFETVAVILKWVAEIGARPGEAHAGPAHSYLAEPL